MNQNGLFSSVLLIVFSAFSQIALADWQVTSPEASAPREPFFQTGTQRQAISTTYRSEKYPSKYANLGCSAPSCTQRQPAISTTYRSEKIPSKYAKPGCTVPTGTERKAAISTTYRSEKYPIKYANPGLTAPTGRERQAAISTAYRSEKYPIKYANPVRTAPVAPTAPIYAVSISGSLKENIERIMRRYHWRVVWKAPYDYNFDGRITGTSLPNVLQKLLQPFPLQAVMYMSNHTVAILPRQTR